MLFQFVLFLRETFGLSRSVVEMGPSAVTLAATPMFGVVFGRTNAVAPGCETSLTWKRLNGRWDFTTYVFNVGLGAPSVLLGLAYSF
jgi:hypothetical protein